MSDDLNDTATTGIYTLSLHDALPILNFVSHGTQDLYPTLLENDWGFGPKKRAGITAISMVGIPSHSRGALEDRKSTRLNSSHVEISYAVFCLKKKKNGTSVISRSACA